ncbi:MAG: tRNA (adenosine(37)-N6)-threonylcarbamoyltransferase complex transferase subunit TsaD [Bacteriovoracaceae bacterium]|nr:tRNA (adenosine(37)-N6)-threonylcarbamoyltransferase complex transferase subunit TsaD [Bacteriovoracaceae bacterium]
MAAKIALGIETSCDDTSLAILQGDPDNLSQRPKVLAHHSFSQIEILKKWGGVVPEIAARNHLYKLVPLLKEVLRTAKLEIEEIDLIGVTTEPGLLGPLLTGLNTAKTIALRTETPIVPINHLYAHLEAIFISDEVSYPYLGLLISGGHTMYLYVESPKRLEVLGSTIDDAAGEAFDKGGKQLGLPYPAGRDIDKLAKKGNKDAYHFPIGLKSSADCNFSFSGLKTSLRTFIEKQESQNLKYDLNDVCASYQEAISNALKLKLNYALKMVKEKTGKNSLPLVVGGGVACNSRIREVLTEVHSEVYFVKPEYCTDNGAMIANYTLRTADSKIDFPDCLYIDARGKFVDKKKLMDLYKCKGEHV